MIDLTGFEIALGWDGPTLYVTCRRCLDEAVAHALFERPSTCVKGEMEPNIYPPWGDDTKVALYREWQKQWEHWDVVGSETAEPATVMELMNLVTNHEAMFHAMGDINPVTPPSPASTS